MENKKKILYVITKSNWGGAQRYVFDLAVSMKSKGFNPIVALGIKKNTPSPLKERLTEEKIPTIPLFGLDRDVNIFSDIKTFFELLKLIYKEKPEIVHLNSSKIGALGGLAVFFCNLLFRLKCLMSRVSCHVSRAIFTVHGFAFNENRSYFQKISIATISWLTVFLCHKTIVISNMEFEQAKKFPFLKNRFIKIWNGISSYNCFSKENAKKEIYERLSPNHLANFSEDTFIIGSIAELHKNKGLEFAIKGFDMAFHEQNDMLFLIIGDGEERENLKNLVDSLGLSEKVIFLGHIPDAKKLLKLFDMFLISSIKEGLPYVALEAGYAGIPILSTNVGGMADIIEDMKNGILVIPKKPNEIKEGIFFLKSKKIRRIELGKQLKLKIESSFMLEKEVEGIIKVYGFI